MTTYCRLFDGKKTYWITLDLANLEVWLSGLLHPNLGKSPPRECGPGKSFWSLQGDFIAGMIPFAKGRVSEGLMMHVKNGWLQVFTQYTLLLKAAGSASRWECLTWDSLRDSRLPWTSSGSETRGSSYFSSFLLPPFLLAHWRPSQNTCWWSGRVIFLPSVFCFFCFLSLWLFPSFKLIQHGTQVDLESNDFSSIKELNFFDKKNFEFI